MENKTHWKKLTNPDYLGAYEILTAGYDFVLTIKKVGNEMVTGEGGKKEECTVAHFAEPQKPMILNKTNMKAIEKLYGTPFIEEWVGRKIQVFAAKVKFGKDIVDGLRIRPTVPNVTAEHVPVDVLCEDCGSIVAAVEIDGKKYPPATILAQAQRKYAKALCYDCMKKLNDMPVEVACNEDNKIED